MPPLGIFLERLPTLFLCSHKDRVVGSYLSVELVVFHERVGHFPSAKGLFQSHIPYGRKAGRTIKENLAKQRVIIPIRSHLPTKHAQVHTRISSTIILDELWCLEFGRHNNLREVGQTV